MLKTKQFSNLKILTGFFLLLTACVNPFAPQLTEKNLNTDLILTEQKSPEDVLVNFSFAYNFQDSIVYSDLLDSSFLFISKDYSTDPVTNLTWGRDTDIRTTVKMFRHFQSLNLVWGRTTSERYLEDDSTAVEMERSFQLTIDGGNQFPTINGTAMFYFIRKNSGIWKITRWEDKSKF